MGWKTTWDTLRYYFGYSHDTFSHTRVTFIRKELREWLAALNKLLVPAHRTSSGNTMASSGAANIPLADTPGGVTAPALRLPSFLLGCVYIDVLGRKLSFDSRTRGTVPARRGVDGGGAGRGGGRGPASSDGCSRWVGLTTSAACYRRSHEASYVYINTGWKPAARDASRAQSPLENLNTEYRKETNTARMKLARMLTTEHLCIPATVGIMRQTKAALHVWVLAEHLTICIHYAINKQKPLASRETNRKSSTQGHVEPINVYVREATPAGNRPTKLFYHSRYPSGVRVAGKSASSGRLQGGRPVSLVNPPALADCREAGPVSLVNPPALADCREAGPVSLVNPPAPQTAGRPAPCRW